MPFPLAALKIAAELIQQRLQPSLSLPSAATAPVPAPAPALPAGRSALRLLNHQRPSASEPAPKVVTDTGAKT